MLYPEYSLKKAAVGCTETAILRLAADGGARGES